MTETRKSAGSQRRDVRELVLPDISSCEAYMQNNNVFALFDRMASESASLPAFRQMKDDNIIETTYGDLQRSILRKSDRLKRHGIGRGDHVLILEPISDSLYSSLLAVMKVGAIATFVDMSSGLKTLDRAIKHLKPRAAILSSKALLLSATSIEMIRLPCKIRAAELNCSAGTDSIDIETAAVQEDQPALVTFTSGTGGEPKVVSRTHKFLRRQLAVLTRTLELDTTGVELTCLPMFVLANLAAGVTTVLSATDLSKPGKVSGRKLCQEIESMNVTRILASPSLVEQLCLYCMQTRKRLPQIKRVFTGGGTVTQKLREKCMQVFSSSEIVTVYGSSEAEPICRIGTAEILAVDRRAMRNGAGALVGLPVREIEIRLLDADIDIDEPLVRNIQNMFDFQTPKIGEIAVTGEHVIKDGSRGSKIAIDGKTWHKTGDIGYFDHLGRLWLVGRVSRNTTELDVSLSYCVEMAATSIPDVSRAAFLETTKGRTLYVESSSGTFIAGPSLHQQLCFAELDKIVPIKKMPVDSRHNTKIVYSSLAG